MQSSSSQDNVPAKHVPRQESSQKKRKEKRKPRKLRHIDDKHFENDFPRLRISTNSRPEDPILPTMEAEFAERVDDARFSNQGFSGPVAGYGSQHPSTPGTNIDPSQDHYATRMAPAQHSSTRQIFSSLSSSRPYLSPYTGPPFDVTNPQIPTEAFLMHRSIDRSMELPLLYSPDFLLMEGEDDFRMHDPQTSNSDFPSSELFDVVEPYNEAMNNIQNFDEFSFASMPRVYHSFSIDDARLSEGQTVVDDLGMPSLSLLNFSGTFSNSMTMSSEYSLDVRPGYGAPSTSYLQDSDGFQSS